MVANSRSLARVLAAVFPGGTPFQANESGVMDLAGGRTASCLHALTFLLESQCETNFTPMPASATEAKLGSRINLGMY